MPDMISRCLVSRLDNVACGSVCCGAIRTTDPPAPAWSIKRAAVLGSWDYAAPTKRHRNQSKSCSNRNFGASTSSCLTLKRRMTHIRNLVASMRQHAS